MQPATGALLDPARYQAHILRSNLRPTAAAVASETQWTDMPWLDVLPSADLQPWYLEIEDQLRQGSCVSNSLTSIAELLKNVIKGEKTELSRDYHYYRGRELDPVTAPPKNGGMTLGQGMQAAAQWGICLEATRPYSDSTYNVAPTAAEDAEAAQHKLPKHAVLKADPYQDIAVTIRRIKEALTLGYPVQIGIQLEQSFFYLQGPCNGRPYNYAGMSKLGAVAVGGHALPVIGYCQRGALDYLKVANSWNTPWGDGGYALLPMSVIAGSDTFDMRVPLEFDGVSLGEPATIQAHDRISRLYVALFGRAPDAEGLAFWTGGYLAGATLETIATQMFAVAPARVYYPQGLTPEQTAAAFYVNVLGRAPDADGLAYWASRIRAITEGPAIQAMVQATAFYDGADPVGAASSDHFNRRVRVARLYAEAGGTVEGAQGAIANVN